MSSQADKAKTVAESPVAVAEKTATPVAAPVEVVNPQVRRQIARERQRQKQRETESPQRSWWTSHAPGIAVGFLLALAITIYLARANRERGEAENEAAPDIEVPELVIEDGGPTSPTSSGLSAPPSFVSTPSPAIPETTGSSNRSPMLLTAKPAVDPELEKPVDVTPPNVESATKPESTARPVETLAETSSPTNESDLSSEYPSTDPTAYRPGGRPPRMARSPAPTQDYPTTSAPNFR